MRIIAVLLGFLLTASIAIAGNVISFTNGMWSTTFDYAECTQRGGGGGTNCDTVKTDDIYWSWGAAAVDGNYTQVSTFANYSGGAGGNGFRAFAPNNLTDLDPQGTSGPVLIDLPSAQKELWIRWYQRYQQGWKWRDGNPYYDKTLYIKTGTPSTAVIPEFHIADYTVISQGVGIPNYYQVQGSLGWQDVMSGSVSDGLFHAYEIYIKMDTDGVSGGASANGVGRLWIDGVLVAENTAVNWSGGDSTAKNGWMECEFESNQRYTDNLNGDIGGIGYIDYDDMAIYNITPPNLDADGNPFIGLYGVDTGPPVTSHNGISRSATAQVITLTPNETATTEYCISTASCTPSVPYTDPVTVKPGKFLCYASTDSASNAETPKCFNPLWPIQCR